MEFRGKPQGRKAIEAPAVNDRLKKWVRLPDAPAHWDVANVTTQSMLDRVLNRLQGSPDEVEPAMVELISTLWSVKSTCAAEVWESVIAQCVNHPLREVIHEDPFASRCFQKPRGYAGDAVLIDYLYTRQCESDGSPPVSVRGKRIFEFTRDIPAGYAVRRRRDLMATIIDELCATKAAPHILSVACGHLREASLSKGVTGGATERFIALDQDELSLATVQQEVARFGVTAVHNSIKAVFRGPVAEEKFDLIYSTGLYDYLDDRIATKLTHRLFDMLNPNGRLVVANFVPNLACSAYMEAMLDWKLIYRDVKQVETLAATIPLTQMESRKAYEEENGNIAFLDIVKR